MNDYFARQKQALVSCSINQSASHKELEIGEDTCLLDPGKNSPMKLFQIRRQQISGLAASGFLGLRMRLSAHEQEVNDIANSVLLIGRSGTGKFHYHVIVHHSFTRIFTYINV